MVPAKKTNMAIFFADSEYLESFMNYIVEKDTGFSCSGFTTGDTLMAYAKENRIAVLLTDEACFAMGAGHINSELTIVLTERPGLEAGADVYTVNILQPVDEIVREIMKAAAKTEISVSCGTLLKAGSVYSFFSPVGRSLKTTLALTAARLLSDRDRTIYLNLEPDSGFSVIFRQTYDTDLSDLMFYLRDGAGERANLMLQGAVCENRGISYIPPVMNPGDLCQISCSEIENLMDKLHHVGYANIVLDMGIFLPGFEKLLMSSSRVFMPVRNDAVSAAKTAQLFSYLRTLKDMPVEEKIERLEPPYFRDIPPFTADMKGTKIAAYVEEILA